jgi:hypothetical protein
MSKKQKPPYLLQIANAEQAALLVDMCQKVGVTAPQAHVLASIWTGVQACAQYFADGNDAKR